MKSKLQIPDHKSQKRSFLCLMAGVLAVFTVIAMAGKAKAEEITILFSGETHAMLYPCSCPVEPDGGIARRATLVKQIRKTNPEALLVDSGGFFAGGAMDEYTQNTQMDQERTKVQLKAMQLMQYDAVAVGDEEFNFDKDFLLQQVGGSSVAFLSSNLFYANPLLQNPPKGANSIKPYLIKSVSGIKVGIIGLTSPSAASKAGGLQLLPPDEAVKKAVKALKAEGAELIVLLSHQGEQEDMRLIKDVPGIDVLVVGHSRAKEEFSNRVGSTVIARPVWQGRHLGKLVLTIKNKKVERFTADSIRLSDQLTDDKDVLSIMPRCFSDNNCKKEGLVGMCNNPGTVQSQCLFTEAAKVNLLVITPKECKVCDTKSMTGHLKKLFPGLSVQTLHYPDAGALKLMKEFDIKGLPVFLLGKECAKEQGFKKIKEHVLEKDEYFLLKSEFAGLSYFQGRKKVKGAFDIFLSVYGKDIAGVLASVKDLKPTVHFLVAQQDSPEKFDAQKGKPEIEESLRAVCVQKYYPERFWDYLSCRVKNIESSWWDDCLEGADTKKIRSCSKGAEGEKLLEDNIALNKELKIMLGPAYLMDNQEIFGLSGIPSKEDFKKILGR